MVIADLMLAFISFSMIASAIYIINDYRDIEADRAHPEKSKRPLASGAVSVPVALAIFIILIIGGLGLAFYIKPKFLFVLSIYLSMNIAYSMGLKKIPILDIFIVAIGFVLRVKSGGVVANIAVTDWLNIMIFLLAVFLTLAKRRDDVLIKVRSGKELRGSIRNYNMELMNALVVMVSGIIIVAYIMYTLSPAVMERLGTYQMYYTSVFVIAGIMRYLQLVFVENDTGSPTNILYKDLFIQLVIVFWVISFVLLLYYPNVQIFE